MSEAALRERAVKRHWAEPGSRHDSVIRIAKYALPVLGFLLLVMLVVSPFDRKGDVSFILDKKEVDKAGERMKIESARYAGEDNQGNRFVITADNAIQPSSDAPIVNIEGMQARLDLQQGAVAMAALKGTYDLDRKLVAVVGPIHVAGPDGYSLRTRDVKVDFATKMMTSDGPVSGTMRLGEFSAGRMSTDLDSRTVRLDGGVRLKIRQGAVN
jgi:lipopolysaccharide export system protein LptC